MAGRKTSRLLAILPLLSGASSEFHHRCQPFDAGASSVEAVCGALKTGDDSASVALLQTLAKPLLRDAELGPTPFPGGTVPQLKLVPRAFACAVAFTFVVVAVAIAALHSRPTDPDGKHQEQADAAAESARDVERKLARPGPPEKEEHGGFDSGGEEEAGGAEPSLGTVVAHVVGYCLALPAMTLVNKEALETFHPPVQQGEAARSYVWGLLVIQFIFVTVVVRVASLLGLLTCEPLEFGKAASFLPTAVVKMVSVAAGNAVMDYSSINAYLALQACVPLLTGFAELMMYADQTPPPALSWLWLLAAVMGSLMYSLRDGTVIDQSWTWGTMFVLSSALYSLMVKHFMSWSRLSRWGLVYYNTALSLLPAVVFTALFEIGNSAALIQACRVGTSPAAMPALVVSCVLSVVLSFFQVNLRNLLTATAFLVLGLANRSATVLANNVLLEHAHPVAVVSIVVSFLGALLWRESVGRAAIQTRARSATWEQRALIPYCLCVVTLAWTAYLELNQVV